VVPRFFLLRVLVPFPVRENLFPVLKNQLMFQLPPKGALRPNGPADPLPYYYAPMIGLLYRRRIEQGLAMLSPPYGSILEVGYGSGVLLPSLCRIGDYVAGVDLNSDPQEVGAAVSRLGAECELRRGDLLDDLFHTQKFDLVVAFSVLEHIADLEPVLSRFHELLSPSGHLLVGMPRVDRFMEKAFEIIGFSNIEDHHVTDYRTCLRQATRWFDLEGFSHMPSWLPERAGIYFNMFFVRKDT